MRRCHPTLTGFILTFLLLVGCLSCFATASQTPSFSGTVSIVTASMGLAVGAEWGKGILTLTDSQQYGFTVISGSGGMAIRNQNGVVIYLEAIEQGVEVRLGAAGVEIKLTE